MWTYLANSLAYSSLGLIVGAALAEAGYDLGSIIRHAISGRRKDDNT